MKFSVSYKSTVGAIAAAGFAAISAGALAADWSDDSVAYIYGTHYHESYIPYTQGPAQNIKKDIFEFTHVDGWKYGGNLFVVDLKHSDSNDPASDGSSQGANDVYAVYRTTLSFSKVSGTSMKWGPIRDVGMQAGFDYSVKDTTFGARTWRPKIGPVITWDIPKGFLDTAFLYQKEWNHCGTCNPAFGQQVDVNFGGYFGYEMAWGAQLGDLPLKFKGVATWYAKKGNNGDGSPTAPETYIDARLMYDVGALMFKKDTVLIGAGWLYWNNQFGNKTTPVGYPFGGTGGSGEPIPGSKTNMWRLMAEWHM
jgi:nucleoside-specific outer membrane channel protein Tsx